MQSKIKNFISISLSAISILLVVACSDEREEEEPEEFDRTVNLALIEFDDSTAGPNKSASANIVQF